MRLPATTRPKQALLPHQAGARAGSRPAASWLRAAPLLPHHPSCAHVAGPMLHCTPPPSRRCRPTDLVPREVGEQWLKYYRQELPTVAFKASTQQQGTGLSARGGKGGAAKAAAG